jgi:hypothetical protein
MTDCPNQDKNLEECACTYPGCSRKGLCCDCIRHHRLKGEIPGCLFPREAERSFDRSVEAFLRLAGKES